MSAADISIVDDAIKPKRAYARWRALSLTLVYVLMGLHIAHWMAAGKTMAPLELNEVMYTFELGIVTAGFLFMCTAFLVTAVFGRFFCSWGCHILALQDLCGWLLAKLRIRPVGVRSRLLVWVPITLALYMFCWPQVIRIFRGESLPELHAREDAQGWASFSTEQFWRNLPGPGITVLTFALCGFVIVYLLGSRAFCAYACPYGVVFRLADRLAPGRIRVGDDCTQCGTCTAVCTSGVRVHEELNRYGMVVNPACMKDLDCIAACPEQSLKYGFGRPTAVRRTVHDTTVRKQYDFTLGEEWLMALIVAVVVVVFRGLYDVVPLFMTVALGVIIAYLFVVLLRVIRSTADQTVRLNRWALVVNGRLLMRGRWFAAAMAAAVLFIVHSAVVHHHTVQGRRWYRLAFHEPNAPDSAAERARLHLESAGRWGLVRMDQNDVLLADLYARKGRWDGTERLLRTVVARRPENLRARADLAEALLNQGEPEAADEEISRLMDAGDSLGEAHYYSAGYFYRSGRLDEARRRLEQALRVRPDVARFHLELGAILSETGDTENAVRHLRQAAALEPNLADAHHNLAVALAAADRLAEALAAVERSYELRPDDPQTRALRARIRQLMSAAGRP